MTVDDVLEYTDEHIKLTYQTGGPITGTLIGVDKSAGKLLMDTGGFRHSVPLRLEDLVEVTKV